MSDSEMLLITGATGQLGSLIAEQLLARGRAIRLLARNPQKLARFSGVETVQGDYADEASLDRAFLGISAGFVVSGYAAPGERALLHRNAFEAARRAGVRYLIYLSFLGAAPDSRFPMSRDHYQSEQFLQKTGIPHAICQDSFYSELALQMFNEKGVMSGPGGNGGVSWVGRAEIAEAVCNLLSEDRKRTGIFRLTGPEALTLHETASVLSSLTGRALRYEEETVDQGRAWRSTLGAPPWEVDTWIGSYEAIAAGEVAGVYPDLEALLGRPGRDLRSYLSARERLR